MDAQRLTNPWSITDQSETDDHAPCGPRAHSVVGMGAVRVMFIGQGPSGLAIDRVVNTFHFWDAGARDPADVNACMNAVETFYTGVGGVGAAPSTPVGDWLSPWVDRDAELRGYDMQEPGAGHNGEPPRTPTIRPIHLGGPTSQAGMPEEVACIITVHGAPPLGKRRRGRIYIGPLVLGALTPATASTPGVPDSTFITNLTIAAKQLCDQVMTPLNWSIRSEKPQENYVPIVSGYVDNAFDTQRRRGPGPTQRTPFIGQS